MRRVSISSMFATIICLVSVVGIAAEKTGQAKSRTFRLDYGATLEGLPEGARVRVWLPVPQSNEHQVIKALKPELPCRGRFTSEPKYGNRILYLETTGSAIGRLTFTTSYDVARKEARGLSGNAGNAQLSDAQRRLFLSSSSRVPLQGKQLRLLEDLKLSDESLSIARALYERVDEHVRYDKSRPGYGHGDVQWVCDSRFGNCTDFHSLFISLSRAQGVPARFEIGFPLPPERGEGTIGGYHCWAMFHVDGQGWVPVDISEADKHPEMKEYYFGNLTEDRVTFTIGRDI